MNDNELEENLVSQEEETEKTIEQPAPKQEPEVQVKPKESSKEINFRNLRLENERLSRDQAQLLEKLKQYESSKTLETEEDLEIDIGDDDLFEGKHYKKIQKQLKRQQDELRKYQKQSKITSTEARLKAQFPDFDKVINEENISRLRSEEPELSATIASTADIYNKAVSAYKMIKKLGIYVEDNYQADKNAAHANSLKPRPSAAVSPQRGDSPLTKANAFADGLTPELKKQLWKEMEEHSKNY